ncbi:MAG: glutamine synthetase family protein [Candidatus Nanopelagicales bacterium]|nr:glutamine synthetase family protein [Candidatus Nanopelagicales bacterium]MCF8537288.1 glutamine synthetase family protein [Candidatus Nanopelagicales bacterium]MCF8542625.1 glutamine synthetase family protein [Candidatus Nanopelagicales bacterium]MCF8557719.1 glutamine synthetase family protein [Candidatus Nanopelagicales bacterium]
MEALVHSAQPLTLDNLRTAVADGTIDTVAVSFTDMQGRLQGKRIHAPFFLDEVVHHGTEGCNYLLAVDIDMNTVSGYAMSSWDTGYADFVLAPDFATLHRVPWEDGTVGVLCDLLTIDGEPVTASPRQVLRRQAERLADAGMVALAGTELEFIVFRDTYEEAWASGYRDLTPANQYNVDYSMLGTARVEPLLRRIRNEMYVAGMTVESAKGECNLGQHEIAFKYREALGTCDNHVIYKTGAKEIAAQEGMALTFMAKYNEREGNSCHIHLSFRGADGALVMADDSDPTGMSALGKSFVAGQLAHALELSLLFAPQINSYKRYVEGSFAPTSIRWGRDNRTLGFRLVGHGPSLRLENRIPGGDVNPYLAVAGIIAAGIDGIDRGLELEPEFVGNAYVSDSPRVPTSLSAALDLWQGSSWVRETFGEDVQAHYANMARVEIAAFGAAVTDWERYRSFERI